MDKSSLGDRMKRYEAVSSHILTNRTPVIIRIDGKAFHTFTRGMDRPFDDRLSMCMQETMKALVSKISGCFFAYTQSDEISLLLIDYRSLETQPWFDNKLQKIASVSSSMATAYFNKWYDCLFNDDEINNKLAMFDARVFNLPREEVTNYFIWRQQDCTRNSVQMVGRANFSHKQLEKKNCSDIQEMLFNEKGINWNDTPVKYKRGSCAYRNYDNGNGVTRSSVIIDDEIPVFTKDREFIEKWVSIDQTSDKYFTEAN